MLQTAPHAAGCLRDTDAVARRHATWFTSLAEAADAQLRTPAERAGHDRIEARLDELRAAHRWARSHDALLAARLTAALQLHAHTRLWNEPAQWAAELSLVLDPGDPMAAHVWAAMANAAAHEGRLADGVDLAERALDTGDSRATAVALEALADIMMYEGDLARCGALAHRLREVGERSGDRHAVALGHVDLALALTYAADPASGLELLAGLDRIGLAPSDLAWVHYAEGEALAVEDPRAALAAFDRGIDLADRVGNRFLGGVARVSASSVTARSGDAERALPAFARIIEDWRRQGNRTHLVILLRNLVELLVRIGANDPAAMLLGALESAELKATYGQEAQTIAAARATLEARVGAHHLQRSMARGHGKDVLWAADVAIQTIRELP